MIEGSLLEFACAILLAMIVAIFGFISYRLNKSLDDFEKVKTAAIQLPFEICSIKNEIIEIKKDLREEISDISKRLDKLEDKLDKFSQSYFYKTV